MNIKYGISVFLIIQMLVTSAFSQNIPLTTDRMYHPDSTIKSGRWGAAVNIRETKSFDKFTTKYMEPGISWTNGMFTTPGNTPTEMIYYHDGSRRFLSGYVSILDCIDYCGSIGDCEFIIKGDSKQLWNSGVVRQHDKPLAFKVSLKGVKELRLITNSGGDNIDEDWGCWMEMKVSKKGKKSGLVQAIKDDNILINGSFEEGGPAGYYKTLRKGDKISGWTVTKATVDLTGNYFKAQDGQNSIDLNGTPGFGGIQQRFFTDKGKKYLLSFYLAGNPEGGPKIKNLLVSFGDQTVELEFDITGKTRENMGWEYKELVFKAKQRATILKFESNHLSGPLNWGPVIDNVKLVPYKSSKHHKITDNTSLSLFGLKYGILAGGSLNFINDNSINRMTNYNTSLYQLTTAGNTIGLHFGIMSQLRIWRILLKSEFLFNFNKIEYNIINKSNSSKNTVGNQWFGYMDTPVLIGYKSGNLRFMAGPVWHFLMGNLSAGRKGIAEFSRKLKVITIGFQTGIGFDTSNFNFDLRYETNCRFLGDGIKIKSSGKKTYFAETPGRLVLTISSSIK